MAAQHCEGRGWVLWQEFTMTSKFRGAYLQIIPLGILSVARIPQPLRCEKLLPSSFKYMYMHFCFYCSVRQYI